MTEDQVVTTGVDVTALSGLELRKAVATALGWTVSEDRGDGEFYRLNVGGLAPTIPHFESSLDACFAPGGPVERLREDGWGLKLGSAVHGRWYTTLTRSRDGTHRHVGDSGDRPAEAVCRAFLTAVSERGQ